LLNVLYCIFPINSSTVSDDGHDQPSKKEDSKKDRGYAALEGKSSPEEDPEI
jgi:hypothetical protein